MPAALALAKEMVQPVDHWSTGCTISFECV